MNTSTVAKALHEHVASWSTAGQLRRVELIVHWLADDRQMTPRDERVDQALATTN